MLAKGLEDLRSDGHAAAIPPAARPAQDAAWNGVPRHPRSWGDRGRYRRAVGPRFAGRRHRVVAASLLLALVAGLGLAEASGVSNVRGVVVRLFFPDGTLVVEVDDPGVSVRIDGSDLVITGTGVKELRVKPGDYRVVASKDGRVVQQELVRVERNGRASSGLPGKRWWLRSSTRAAHVSANPRRRCWRRRLPRKSSTPSA